MTAREWFWTEGHQAEGVALTDRGILYGEGLFETFLLHRGRPFRLEEHLARMRCSAAALEIPLPRPRWEARVTAGLRQLVERSGISQGRVRLTLTAGAAGPSGDPAQPAAGPGRLLLRLAPYTPPVAGLSGWRVLPAGPPVAGVRGSPPSHKSLSYLGNLLCLRQARRKGAQEGLLHTKDGRIVSGSRSTLFLVFGRCLMTPPLASGCLPGVTRALVLNRLADALGLAVEEKDLVMETVRNAHEAFLTNSLWGIMPVRTDPEAGPGRNGPGPVTSRIIRSYWSLLAVECGSE